MARNIHLQNDLNEIIDGVTGVGSILDELTLLRVSIKCYLEGMSPAEAVAWACQQLSDSITKHPTQ